MRTVNWSGRTVELCAIVSIALASVPVAHTAAQERDRAVHLRVGAGLGLARTSVGGETSSDVGPFLSAQLGVAISPATDLTLGAAFQPFKAQNPVIDEAYTGIYTLAGLQVGLGETDRLYFRPELGLVFRSWSGSEVFVSSETSLAAGLAFGREWPLGRKTGLAIEAFIRLSGADELSTNLVGIGASLVPVGARPSAP